MAEEKIKSLDEDINALLLSPIYNMSMCTLENFHTEFWKWLGKTYPHKFLKAIVDKDYPEISQGKIEFKSQVKINENSILDLQIEIDKDGKKEYIIIENKIKSYPNNKQLESYANAKYFEGKKATFILTSLSPALHLHEKWIYVSYKDISNGLKREFIDSNFEYKDSYHKLLIKDYINVITTLYNIFSPENTEKKYDFYYVSPEKIKLCERNEKLKKIHLDDIYKKFRTAELANYINGVIDKDDCLKEKRYAADSSFHNKKGTIDIWNNGEGFPKYSYKGNNGKDIEENFNIRIQIEENQYRYCLVGLRENDGDKANEIREKICNELMEKGLWFNHDKIKKTTRTKIYNSFCGYRGGFIYRYFLLTECFNSNLADISYESIANQVKKDLDSLYQVNEDSGKPNIEYINEIITKNLENLKNLKEFKDKDYTVG